MVIAMAVAKSGSLPRSGPARATPIRVMPDARAATERYMQVIDTV